MLITTALPYINGIIHIGHVYELHISKIYYCVIKKYYNCKVFSGLDCHGLIKKTNLLKINYLNKKKQNYFNFKIKNKKTNSFINKRICNWIYIFLCDKNKIFSKIVLRFFNKKKNFFIPDKYIKIFCKNCNFEINNLYCSYCKNEKFLFIFKLDKKNIILKKIKSIFLKNYIFNDWDISREKNYNGILILSKKKIFFYVWYDALISYISNNLKFLKKKYINEYLLQIIGKDIVYFHKIFNIILFFLKFKNTKILVHGFVKLEKKISKSEKKIFNKAKNNLLIFFFIINNKNNLKDIKYNLIIIKKIYKKIFLNKILNLFFRIRKILYFYDNKINEYLYYKKNHLYDFNFLKKNKLNIYYQKKILDLLKINKLIDKNKFWKKKNKSLIHYFYSKIIFLYIKKINIILKVLNNKKLKTKYEKNNIIFNLKKIYEN